MDRPNDSAATETRPSMSPDVRISVTNFGPITEGTIDLRPLTVFVGPSNTGKTYLAVLIYALHRVLDGFPRLPIVHRFVKNDVLIASREELQTVLERLEERPRDGRSGSLTCPKACAAQRRTPSMIRHG